MICLLKVNPEVTGNIEGWVFAERLQDILNTTCKECPQDLIDELASVREPLHPGKYVLHNAEYVLLVS